MTALREAAQQLLGALDKSLYMNDYCGLEVSKHDQPDVTDAIENLRAALAEPVQEPVAQVHPNHLKPTDDGKPWCREVLLYSGDHNGDLFKGENYRVKLYTAPSSGRTASRSEHER